MKKPVWHKFRLALPVGLGLLLLSLTAGLVLASRAGEAAWLPGTAVQTDRLLSALLEPCWERLEDTQSAQEGRVTAEGSEVLVDDMGNAYSLPPGMEIPQGRSLLPCLGPDGECCLALLEAGTAVRGMLVEMDWLYDACVPQELAGRVILADKTGTVLIYPQGETVGMQLCTQLEEAGHPLAGAGRSLTSGAAGAAKLPGGEILWILPAGESRNGFLTLGILADSSAEPAAWLWGLCGLTAGIGLAMVLAFLRHRRGRAEILGQLALLERKNAAMEELNRKKQQLAHQQRLEIMGTLTSGIAHEFNNLLVPIMGYSMMALEKLPQEEAVYDDVLEIYNTSRKAQTLIRRLSDLSRKNSDVVFRLLSPENLVTQVLKVAKPAQPETVTVQTRLDCCGALLRGNEVQLSQMLLNLVLNAFHAMPDGGTLTMEAACREGKIHFVVSDTGTGIAPEVISHIFEPFFSTKDPGQGTGLGLAIVHQVVEDHGGDIDVQSRLGVGTAFFVTFPQAEPEEAPEE